MNVAVRSAASADIFDIATYLETVRTGTGTKFALRVRRILDTLERMPRIYPKLRGTVRAARVGRFHYILYYRITRRDVDVFAVIHSSRETKAWTDRV